ncbi:SUMF1/EgtB/PvdO family nonheme iron enzyme, partial [bacterium]|nr:SUMF1/EgtB/PvdO family nonheme iron enzyme [candidate division CSSED10-310 bacterium]
NRYAAVKMLFPHLAGERNFVKRFREEMQAMSKLKHPNIVDIYDYEEAYETYFIIMEVVVGRSLDTMIKETGVLDIDTSVSIIRQVLKALQCAHSKGIFHRDIKPNNIMINDAGLVKVLDFGISKIIGGENLTQTGFMVGTPQYISPEQAKGEPITAASDLYSVSVVLFEMLTGEPPFKAETPVALAMAHIKDTPTKPKKINPNVTSAMDRFIMRGLEKNPSKRFASAEEMLSELDRICPAEKDFSEKTPRTLQPVISKPGKDQKERLFSDDSSQETILREDIDVHSDKTLMQPSYVPFIQRWILNIKSMSYPRMIGYFIFLTIIAGILWLSLTSSGRSVFLDSYHSVAAMFAEEEIVEAEPETRYFAIPENVPKAYGNVFGITFEVIGAGEFTMGAKPGSTGALDDSPDHKVYLDTFLISHYEITNKEYAMFIQDTGYPAPPYWNNGTYPAGKQNRPVVQVSWFDAKAYCNWLSQKTGLSFRLPTEAEWERAANAGKFPWGDRWRTGAANVLENGTDEPVDIGSFDSDKSLTGVYDMGGNIREWTQDYYSMSEYAVSKYRNPSGPNNGNKRVVRGGAFNLTFKESRVTRRNSADPRSQRENLGFRIVLNPTSETMS